MTSQQDQGTKPSHPFPAAIAARDHTALVETLAPDVVLHSAVTAAPFEGRDTVAEVYASVIDSFEHVEVVDEFAMGDTHAFFWRGRIEAASWRGPTGSGSMPKGGCERSRWSGGRSRASRPFSAGSGRASPARGGASWWRRSCG
jgi:SnoaL-like domain